MKRKNFQTERQCYDRSLFRHTSLSVCRAVSDLADRDTEYQDQYYKCCSQCSKKCRGRYSSHPGTQYSKIEVRYCLSYRGRQDQQEHPERRKCRNLLLEVLRIPCDGGEMNITVIIRSWYLCPSWAVLLRNLKSRSSSVPGGI